MEISTDKGIIQESLHAIDLTSFKEISTATAVTAQTALVTVNVVLDEEKYYYEVKKDLIVIFIWCFCLVSNDLFFFLISSERTARCKYIWRMQVA